MENSKTLSAAQIRYLRIGPRVNQSKVLKQQLINAIEEENIEQNAEFNNGVGKLNKIPKYGYGELSKTVNNFGVLINHNFGNSSSLHQLQKFGKLAKEVDNIMQLEKDKISNNNDGNSSSKVENNDKRQFLKSIYNYQGEKIFVVLHSFSVEAVGENYKEVLPFSEMTFLVTKVGSNKLSGVIETALRFETESVEINFDKIKEKFVSHTNSEEKYQNMTYKFEKIESGFKQTVVPSNKEIIEILNQEFDNVHDLVHKYFDHEGFAKNLDPESVENSMLNGQDNMSPEQPDDSLHQNGESDNFGEEENEN